MQLQDSLNDHAGQLLIYACAIAKRTFFTGQRFLLAVYGQDRDRFHDLLQFSAVCARIHIYAAAERPRNAVREFQTRQRVIFAKTAAFAMLSPA